MKISEIIRGWYEKNCRDLPWRATSDPYSIWLSEIILQQTRVDQGLPYYLRFMEAYPNVDSLAVASEQEVMKLWQGLGYYSRARNLQTAANQVVELYEGEFPQRYSELIKLKGVGPYTAAAIASIAFGEAVAVVDGNVDRVISRLLGITEPVNSTPGKRRIQEAAEELLDRNDPGTHNQGIMEFGATHCVPRNPNCSDCPLLDQCVAGQAGTPHEYPVKIRKGKTRKRYFTYFIFRSNGSILIQKREQQDIWQQLYDFPMVEEDAPMKEERFGEEAESVLAAMPGEPKALEVLEPSERKITPRITGVGGPLKHILSHQQIFARFIEVDLDRPSTAGPGQRWIPEEELQNYPIPRLIDRYLQGEG